MITQTKIKGSIPEIVRNDHNLYEGNLVHYFRILFFSARNLQAPYHNARHMLHVVWACYQAIIHYRVIGHPLSERSARNLLVAAIFHDFDHTARAGKDSVNIELAVKALKDHILPQDQFYLGRIESLIRYTEYPHSPSSAEIGLEGEILRDADLCQALSPVWLQQIVFGLAEEWNMDPIEVLKKQITFHGGLEFRTDWARSSFPQQLIEQKIEEAEELLLILHS